MFVRSLRGRHVFEFDHRKKMKIRVLLDFYQTGATASRKCRRCGALL